MIQKGKHGYDRAERADAFNRADSQQQIARLYGFKLSGLSAMASNLRAEGHPVISMRRLLPLPVGWSWSVVQAGIVEATDGLGYCSIIDGLMIADIAPMDVVAAVVQRWERMCAAVESAREVRRG